MKIFRLCIILLLALFCAGIAFAGGAQETEQPADSQPEAQTQDAKTQHESSSVNLSDRIIEDSDNSITIIDDIGDKVVVPKPVEKIVILDGKSAFALRGLHAEELVIAHSSAMKLYERLFPHITATPDLGKGELDYEKIIELDCWEPTR